MARHTNAGDRSFAASLLRAAAGGLAALVITFGITGALTVLGRDDGSGGPAMVAQPTDAAPSPPGATVAPPTQTPSEAQATKPPEPPEPSEAGPTTHADSVGPVGTVTVQVLDAVGTGTQAQEAAAVLRELGYEVVVVNPTPRRVKTTTILATQGHKDDAEDLRDADPRFTVIKPNRAFNESVDLHVLVGPDFKP